MLICDLDLPTLTNLLKEWNEPAYRAKQIWQGLYHHLYNSPEQFTNLPKSLREKLTEHTAFTPFTVKVYQDSSDGFTRKTLFELPDNNLIEAVLMTFGGGAIGVLVGVGVAVLLSVFAGWATHVSPMSVIMATGFSAAVGVLFGLRPAMQAAALNPIEALRYE